MYGFILLRPTFQRVFLAVFRHFESIQLKLYDSLLIYKYIRGSQNRW